MKKWFLLSTVLLISNIIYAQSPMIVKWEITNTSTKKLSTKGSATYTVKNNVEEVVFTGNLNEGVNHIDFPEVGDYTMEISNTSNFAFTNNPPLTTFPEELKELTQWGDADLNTDLTRMFAYSVMKITASDIPNFKPNTSLYSMFMSNFTDIGDLSNWDVSNVNNMAAMFANTQNFTSDLSGWDVSGVTDMTSMFVSAHLFNSNLSNWDVSNLISANGMFSYASSFTSDLSGWDTSSITSTTGMFHEAGSFTSDLSGWDVSKVTEMIAMFNESGMSCQDYSKTLIGWSLQDVRLGVLFGAHTMEYGPQAVQARNILASDKGWDIEGDEYNENCLLDISDIDKARDILVLNPIRENIQLFSDEIISKVEVYDLTGKKVKEFKGLTATATDLRKGFYLLKIYTSKGVKSFKIIKD